jgi:hypothetical protein
MDDHYRLVNECDKLAERAEKRMSEPPIAR